MTLSFRRQYPRWLFPGESDREPGMEGYREAGVDYVIDSLDPRSWRRAARMALARGSASILIPWWTVFWAPCFGYLAATFRKARRRVIFLCHNVVDHEAAWWKTRATFAVLSRGSRFLTHGEAQRQILLEALPGADVRLIPFPPFDLFPEPRGLLPRRARREFLFFGFVRHYKGLDVLLKALAQLPDRDWFLTVAGEFWEGLRESRELVRRLGLGDRVEIIPRYHSTGEAAELFARADAVVLPYRDATGSAVVSLARRYGKPVVATRVGGLAEAVAEGETGWLVPPLDPAALAAVLARFDPARARDMESAIRARAEAGSWTRLVEAIAEQAAEGTASPAGR